MDETPVVDILELRDLAEGAAVARAAGAKPYYVLYDPGRVPPLFISDELPAEPTVTVIARVSPKNITKDRPVVTSATISAGDPPIELVPQFDAVFWSESAVEKFVLTYYASWEMWLAANELQKISYYWYGFVPQQEAAQEGQDPDIPFAIGHTPGSEWQPFHDLPGSNLSLLFRGANGVYAKRLSELPDPPAGWRGPTR